MLTVQTVPQLDHDNPHGLIVNIFDILTKNNHELVQSNLLVIRDSFHNILNKYDYNKIDSSMAYNIINILDKLCMVNKYHKALVLPSIILMEGYLEIISNNYLEAQQLVNDIRQVKDKDLCSYDMDLDILQEIIKDIYTSGLVDNSILEKYVVLQKFDNMRSLSTLMSNKDMSCKYSNSVSDISKISCISDNFITKLKCCLTSNYSFDYDEICRLHNDYSGELLDSVNTDLVLTDFCLIIQSVFNHLLHMELKPNNEEDKILEILSLISKLSKQSKFNPIITVNRLCISNILRITSKYEKYRSQINYFNKYSLGIIQYSKYNEYSLEVYDSLLHLLNLILSDKCCSIDMVEYIREQPLKSNYFKEILNSKLSNINENSLPIHCSLGVQNDLYYSVEALTEGFKILHNGNIQLMFDRESHPMDEYTNNHRLLKYNHKLGNFEGMKYNLVYLLILIEALEAKVIYNSKANESDKTEAKKVVRLCKGDLGVYLPLIQKNDKSFDLNRFYNQVKDESDTIEINTVDTISGIKMIIKTIL